MGDYGSVQVRSFLVHVQHTGNKILTAESYPKSFQVGIYPIVQLAVFDGFRLILDHFAVQPGCVDTVLDCFRAIGYSIRKRKQFPILLCPVRIGIARNIYLACGILSLNVA